MAMTIANACQTLKSLLALLADGDAEAPALLEDWVASTVASTSASVSSAAPASWAKQRPALEQLCNALSGSQSAAASRALTVALLRFSPAFTGQGVALGKSVVKACSSVLARYREFIESAAKLPLASIPRYALPLDLALAAAHTCDILMCAHLEMKRCENVEGLAELLFCISRLPALPLPQGVAADHMSEGFGRISEVIRTRSAHGYQHLLQLQQGSQNAAIGAGDCVKLRAASKNSAEMDDGPLRLLLVDGLSAFVAPIWGGGTCLECPLDLLRYVAPRAALDPSRDVDMSEEEVARHLAILELPLNAQPQDIARAYRRLARLHHPDKGGLQSDFVKIREAFEVLSIAPVVAPKPRSTASRRQHSAETPPRRFATAPKASSPTDPITPSPVATQTPAAAISPPGAPRKAAGRLRKADGSPVASTSQPDSSTKRNASASFCTTPTKPATVSSRSAPPHTKRRPAAPQSGISSLLCQPPAKRQRGAAASSGVTAAAGQKTSQVPGHELTVNGIMQLIWSFAFWSEEGR